MYAEATHCKIKSGWGILTGKKLIVIIKHLSIDKV